MVKNPDARDIVLGLAVLYPDRVAEITSHIDSLEDGYSLNLLNLRIIMSVFHGWEKQQYIEQARTLLDKGFVGTTLFDALSTEALYRTDEEFSRCLEAYAINAMELAEENGLQMSTLFWENGDK